MSDSFAHERRNNSRVLISCAVKERIGKDLSLCQAGNISISGMLLSKVFEKFYPALPKCWVEFSIPGSNLVIAAKGQIVRQERKGGHHITALKFSAIAPSHQRMIAQYAYTAPLSFDRLVRII